MCVPCSRATTGEGPCGGNATGMVVMIQDDGQVLAKLDLCDFCLIWALDYGLITGYIEVDQ